MAALGYSEKIEKIEGTDFLLFRIVRKPIWIVFGIAPAICGSAFLYGFLNRRSAWMVGSAILFVIFLLTPKQDETIELQATDRGLTVNIDVIRWRDIRGLEYRAGSEDTPNGLYVQTGRWGGRFLIQDLGKDETNEMIDTIYRRFPFVEMADNDGNLPSIIGKSPEIITLGLSKKD